MGLDALVIGVQIRKFTLISIRACYRSACKHPFLVGFLCFLLFLYRSFPFVFSLLVSASPVLVCTAILLGTLLSFGQPHIPEIEKEEKITHDITSLKTRVSEDATVVERDDESFDVERFVESKKVVVEKAIEEEEASSGKSEVQENDGLADENSSREIQLEKGVIEEVDREFHYSELENSREIHKEKPEIEGVLSNEEAVENHYSLVQEAGDENLQAENDKLLGESVDALNGDRLDSLDDYEEEASSSESDGAESSSPDASMADIIPLLDELHPLLDSEAPQPTHISRDGSDGALEQSHKSNDGSIDSDDDIEKQGEEDDYNDEEEEEARGGKEVGSESVITWTEDDQKNLMDLGSLELERNQRLENLIARRRFRKSMKLMAEKNLIDLDSADLPFNVPPIATTRRNPFDVPYDSYDNMGLPPIPGSAPSILLPRRNPFDLPYESNEEKPDLKGDSFEQEFTGFHQKDTFFRRHESFSLGPSFLGGPRQDNKWRPVFVPERLASEGTSYDIFQRQLSEVSDSKLSSIPDTDSLSSAADQDNRKLNEQEFLQGAELISNIDHAEHESQSSEDVDSVAMEQEEERDGNHDEVEIVLGDLENQHEMESCLSETGGAATQMEISTSEIHLQREVGEEEYSSRSSSSSLTEVGEKISDVRREEASTSSEPSGVLIEESGISSQPSVEDSHFDFMSGVVEENHHKEPVYDSSPSRVEKHLSFSSISSDLQVEISEMGSSPMSIEKTDHIADIDSEELSASIQKDANGNEDMCEASTQMHVGDENESKPREVSEISEHEVVKVGMSGADQKLDNPNGSMVEHLPTGSNYPSSDLASVEEGMLYKKENILNEDQVHSSKFDVEKVIGVHQDVVEGLDSVVSSHQMPSRDLTLAEPEEQQPSMVVGHVPVDNNISSPDTEPVEECAGDKGGTLPFDRDQVHSSASSGNESLQDSTTHQNENFRHEEDQVQKSRFDTDTSVVVNQDVDEKLDSVVSSYQHMSSTDLTLIAPEEQQPTLVVQEGTVAHTDLSSSESEHVEERLLEEETLQFEQNQVHSTTSDSKIDDGLQQDLDVVVSFPGSDQQHVPPEENSSPELEKQLSWKDKSRVDQYFGNGGEPKEPSIIGAAHREEVSNTSNVNVLEVHDSEDKVSPNAPPLSHGSTPTLTESPKFKSPTSGVDLTDNILAGNANEGRGQISEHFNSAEGYGSHFAEETTIEEEDDDEIKEIDEQLLSELDTVGDFSVEEVVGESVHAEETSVQRTELELLRKDSTQTETNLELPVLEARSFEDIDLAFKQLYEGVDVEEVILTSAVEDQLVESRDNVETKSSLQVLEARSFEDIDLAFKQLHEGVDIEEVILPSAVADQLVESRDNVETNSDLQVLEVRSFEDIDLAFKQLHEGVDIKEVILPSAFEDQLVESKNYVESNSDLPVVEARSLDDLHRALKQVPEGNLDKLPKPLDLKNGSAEVEANEAGSAKEIESRNVESGTEETSTIADATSSDGLGELPKPLDSKTGSAVVKENEAGSTKEIEPRNVESGTEERNTIADATSNSFGELPKPKPLDSKNGSTEVEANEVDSTKEIKSSNDEESGIEETNTTAVDNQKHGLNGTSENSSLGTSDTKGEKVKSHKPSSRDSD